jgi:hypothetical protein
MTHFAAHLIARRDFGTCALFCVRAPLGGAFSRRFQDFREYGERVGAHARRISSSGRVGGRSDPWLACLSQHEPWAT